MGWLYIAAASCLLYASCLGAAVNGEDAVGVSMCCPAGRSLKLVRAEYGPGMSGIYSDTVPKCVRSRRMAKDTLDGATISVADDEKEMVVKKTGVMLPSCPLGLKWQIVNLKKPVEEEVSGSGDEAEPEPEPQSTSRVRLGDYYCGRSKCEKGNVYVDDKPVCDDDWDDDDAKVVCKELGFDGGYATTESKYGNVDLERQTCFDDVRCSGRESSLLDCRHSSQDDCGDSEGAGVVCYGGEGSGSGIQDSYYDAYPSPPPRTMEESFVLLNRSGQLTTPEVTERGRSPYETPSPPTTYKAGEFCMAGVWDNDGTVKGINDELPVGVAVMCEPCKSEALCKGVKELFTSIMNSGPRRSSPPPYDTIDWTDTQDLANNVILVADKDGDGKVNFDEFKAKIEENVEKLFNFLDTNGDGSLDDVQKGVSIKNLTLKLFLDILDETFAFFDVDQDDILSVEDAPERTFYDRNDDGKISLREIFGVSPINMPAPLYRLYTKLDKDKNVKISLEEATNFIKGTFYVIDQNEDCSINLEEFIATLKEIKLPKEHQLAIKLLGDYYFTLGDYFLNEFVSAADADGDKKTTLAEIIGLKDPAVFESLVKVATSMGLPNMGPGGYLIGAGQRHMNWEARQAQEQAVLEMWLNVLYDFVDSRKYDSLPNNLCGLSE